MSGASCGGPRQGEARGRGFIHHNGVFRHEPPQGGRDGGRRQGPRAGGLGARGLHGVDHRRSAERVGQRREGSKSIAFHAHQAMHGAALGDKGAGLIRIGKEGHGGPGPHQNQMLQIMFV